MSIDTAALNDQLDIRDIAERAGAEFRGNRSRCPVHGGDNAQAFEIFDGGRAWSCHTDPNCNQYGHDAIALLRALNGWTFKEVAERYGEDIDPKEAARRAAEHAERVAKELQENIERAQKALEELQKARKYLQYHETMTEQHRALWRARGIPDEWQNFWRLGWSASCPTFHQSPSLTIPIFVPNQQEPVNIRHRLINPPNPQDKYRPERAGLPAQPFYADTTLPIDAADRVIIVEGEIKAAVVFLTLDKILTQVVGIPGKEQWKRIAPLLQGRKDTVIMLDPDAKAEACSMAREIGGARVVDLAEKVDDIIVNYGVGKSWIEAVVNNARKI